MSITYLFRFSPAANREFIRFDSALKERILKKIAFWQKLSNPLSHAKPLKGYPHYFRFRLGDYRIIVKPGAEGTLIILLVLKIAHRREVYD